MKRSKIRKRSPNVFGEAVVNVIGKPVDEKSGHPVVLQRLTERHILKVGSISEDFLWVSVRSFGKRQHATSLQLKMSKIAWMQVVKSPVRMGQIVLLKRGTLVPASLARLLEGYRKSRTSTGRSLRTGTTDSILLKENTPNLSVEAFKTVGQSGGGFRFKDTPKPKPRPRPPWEDRPGPMRRKRND